MTIHDLLAILVPIFALIGLGWLAVTTGLLSQAVGDALSAYVFNLAIPILLFRSLGTFAFPDIDVIPYWATYFSGVAVVWLMGAMLMRYGFGRSEKACVIGGISAGYSNLAFLGIPIWERSYGAEGLIVGLVLIAVHLPIMMTAAVIFIELAERREGAKGHRPSLRTNLVSIVRTLVRNPLMIGLFAGLAFRATGLTLPTLAGDVIDKIADTAIPVALVSLGIGLNRYGIAGNVRPAMLLALIKLFVLPGVVLGLGTLVFGLPPLVAAIATLAAGLATGVNPYLIAMRFKTGNALASNTITLTAIGSLGSTAFWLWVLDV